VTLHNLNLGGDPRTIQVLSYSQISTFISCPYKWLVSYVLGVTSPPPRPLPMAYGSLIHTLREELSRERTSPPEVERLIGEWMGGWLSEAQDAADDHLSPFSDPRLLEDTSTLHELGNCARWWADTYQLMRRENPLTYIALEQPVLVRMRDSLGRPRGDLWVQAILDGLGINDFGEVELEEVKTSGERSLPKYQTKLDGDLQVPLYARILRYVLPPNLTPRRAVYECARRAMPKRPKVVGKGTEKQPYRLSTAKCDTDRRTAEEVIVGNGLDLNAHVGYLANLPGTEAFLARFSYDVPHAQALESERTVVQVARAMRAVRRNPLLAWRNTLQCSNWGCQYKRVCWARGRTPLTAQTYLDAGYTTRPQRTITDTEKPFLVEAGAAEQLRAAGVFCTTAQELVNHEMLYGDVPDSTPF